MSETVAASSSREQRARRSNQTTTTTSDINRDTTRLATSNLADACRYLSLDRSDAAVQQGWRARELHGL